MAARLGRLLILGAAVLAGCGGDSGGESAGATRSDRLVDFSQKPPFVNALEIDPADNSFLLTTNRGFFRISEDGKKLTRVRGTVNDEEGSSPVGTFLEIDAAGPGQLMGSGHPDNARPLPPYLGFMRSDDAGKTWRIVSRLGEADLHQIHAIHDRLYAFDAVLGAILVSEDDGEEWVEHFTPRQLVLDFVVDPKDPEHLVASVENQLYTSEDMGDKWRPAGPGKSPRLDWPEPGTLMRADSDGQFYVSGDGGQSWDRRGRLDGEPYKVLAVDPKHAFVALSDGTIMETDDGGKAWEARFRP